MKVVDIHQESDRMSKVNSADSPNQLEKHRLSQTVEDKSSSTDKVELSARSKEMQKIHEVLQKTPDIRAERVASLKKQIEEGTYDVKSEAIADKMIKESILDLVR
jgi:negative regulator of flagellin synthesis FlgM